MVSFRFARLQVQAHGCTLPNNTAMTTQIPIDIYPTDPEPLTSAPDRIFSIQIEEVDYNIKNNTAYIHVYDPASNCSGPSSPSCTFQFNTF